MDIAANIRRVRQARGLTLDALAGRSGLTKGYLSQIENFRTLPSLPVLYRVAAALGVEAAELLKGTAEGRRHVLTRRGEGVPVEREHPESGFRYLALAREKGAKIMEPFLLELPPRSTRKDGTTNGDEFLHMLEGRIRVHLGGETMEMEAGDSLYFDGSVPHHPENPGDAPARAIVIYAIRG